MNEQSTKLPTYYWIIAAIGLIWNLLGVMNFFGQTFMSEETMATLPEQQQELLAAVPLWLTVVFGIAVFTGTLGCIALLIKKAWAVPVFLVSFIAVCIQMIYNFTVLDFSDAMGGTSVIVMALIFVIAAFLYFYSKKAATKSWLH